MGASGSTSSVNTRYVRIRRPDGSPRVGRLVDDDSIDVLDHDDPLAALSGAGRVVERIRLADAELLPPIVVPEIWCAGVTYDARPGV